MAEFYVERRFWARWPKVLIMCRKRSNGIERRRYVPDKGTCKADETATIRCWVSDGNGVEHQETIHEMECSVCGHTYEHVNGDYEFCPRCGRRRSDAIDG